jgi:trehalose 6-phosphate phosphatase
VNTKHSRELPSALEKKNEIIKRLQQGRPAIFLDYDGTLTPVVEDPAPALLPEKTRRLIRRLSEHWTVVIMTGRPLDDARNLVGLEHLVYVGSHGFGIAGPEGSFQEKPGERFRPALDQAEKEVQEVISNLDGVRLERQPFAIAIHYRQADEGILPELEGRVDEVAARYSQLVKIAGQKILELRPKADWNKGKALLYLVERLHLDESRAVPLYIGDDTTDEEVFEAVADKGLSCRV